MVNHVNVRPDFASYHLGNYRLVRLLGYGGFASVYLGEHLYLKRLAAIKVLRMVLSDKEKARFLEEARLLANLSHPHIVRVLEFAIAEKSTIIQNKIVKENIPFLVMDYAPSGNLRTLYPAGSRLPLNTVVSHIKQVAAALQHAHEQNIIHRDIKPENLLMNERREVMLSDFGLALFAPSSDFPGFQGMVGTLPYTAPEQLQGKPGFASDQYSLGIIAYEWLCGSRPFDGDDVEITLQHISSPPPRPRSKNLAIPRAVEDVILKALAKDPEQRYQNVQDFAQALEQASQLRSLRPATTAQVPAITAQVPAVGNSPALPKREFPALHYFAQKAGMAQPEQVASAHALVSTQADKHDTKISSIQRNRRRMIQKVRAFWIRGVLERSLRGASFITLGLDERQDIVAPSWSPALQQAEKGTHALAPGTSITEIYDQAGGELLILGEAGSGKTTLLLELARNLLDRAEQDPSAPIPVVFMLASWAEKQQPLDEWLIEELNSKYQVPRSLGEFWVRHEMLLPLLDGLDEVAADARPSCVVAINTYKKEHGLSPLVVGSRMREYLLFQPRVFLHSAVVVRPLTLQQIEGYLRSAGEKFEIIYRILSEDVLFQRLVTTPLMLNIIRVAYQDKSPDEILTAGSTTERYQRILRTYVEQMLHRHPTPMAHDPQQLIGWLTSLARRLQQHGQRVFYIEHMQPSWIDKNIWLLLYMWLAVLLPGALIGALAGILCNDLLFHPGSIDSIFIDSLYGAFIACLFSGRGRIKDVSSERQPAPPGNTGQTFRIGMHVITFLCIGLLSYLLLGLSKGWLDARINGAFLALMSFPLSLFLQKRTKAKPRAEATKDGCTRTWFERFVGWHLRNGAVVGLVCGISSILTIIINQGFFNQGYLYLLSLALRNSLRYSLLGTLLGFLLLHNDGRIHPAEIITWSWKRFWGMLKSPKYAIGGMFLGIIIGLSYGLKQASQMNWNDALKMGLSVGLFLALAYYLVAALLQGVTSHNIDDRHRYKPNEGIQRSLHYSLISGLAGVCAGILGYLLSVALLSEIDKEVTGLQRYGHLTWSLEGFKIGLLHALQGGFANLLLFGLAGGLLAGLLLGGLASLQHGILRLILWATGALPLQLPRFLSYAADSALLHRVGGGYIFIHRLLLEYFASLDAKGQPREEEPTSSLSGPLVRLK